MMRTHDFNLGAAYMAQRHAAQAWDIMDATRRFASSFDPYELICAQRDARYAARAARLEYAIACGYSLD